jgi:hypothetical protein
LLTQKGVVAMMSKISVSRWFCQFSWVRQVLSWVWLIISGAIPVVMLAMKLVFCWMVYNRDGDREALAVAAQVTAPGWSALRRRDHRSYGAGRSNLHSIGSGVDLPRNGVEHSIGER